LGTSQGFLGCVSDAGRRLVLAGKRLAAVPDRARNLTALTTVDLSNNQLTAVPESLQNENLTALRELYLSSNQLTAVPGWAGDLTALTTLDRYSAAGLVAPDRTVCCSSGVVSRRRR
jgi:energy-converting hydrogenase Eha subunit B